MNRRSFLKAAGTAAIAATAPKSAAATKPNLVLILADDLGWTGLGCFGSRFYKTPNIDKLCGEGMKFTNGYADAPVCAPTRACVMSGQYTPRTGVYRVTDVPRSRDVMDKCEFIQPEKKQFSLEITTLAEALKKEGYATGHFGKWHLEPHHPSEQGFDSAIVSASKHFDFDTKPPYDIEPGTYLSDFMADFAIEFMETNKDKPFFLYLPDFLVHKPHEAKPDLVDLFKGKPRVGYQGDPVHAAMTLSLDETVGRIVDTIDRLGLKENTLIVFTSDNGARCAFGDDGKPKDNSFTDNLPLRDGKGEIYEGGIRVPYIYRWPGTIKPGTVCSEPITTVDLYPTFMHLATGTPNFKKDQPLDGASVVPCLKSDGSATLDRDALYWYYPNYSAGPSQDGRWEQVPRAAIRMGDYKLLKSLVGADLELYNLKTDIGETKNLAKTKPEKAKLLNDKLVLWLDDIDAPKLVPNPTYNANR
jgi:arylsulfatase A-like enzyme